MPTLYDPAKDPPTPVLLFDTQLLLRLGVASLLDAASDFWVIAQTTQTSDALFLCKEREARIMVLDIDVLGPSVHDFIACVRSLMHDPKVVVLSHRCTEEDIYQTMHAGASGYLLKSCAPDEFLQCLRLVRNGQTFVSPPVASRLAERLCSAGLSVRELQILKRLATGQTNKHIGKAIGISDGTVKSHNKRIFNKLGVTNRMGAVAMAVQRGLIDSNEQRRELRSQYS